MKKQTASLFQGAALMEGGIFARSFYHDLISGNDSRLPAEEKAGEWTYASMPHLDEELFAKHGFRFEPGGRPDELFNRQARYEKNEEQTPNRHMNDEHTGMERQNETGIKTAKRRMEESGKRNPKGRKNPSETAFPHQGVFFPSCRRKAFEHGQIMMACTGPGNEDWKAQGCLTATYAGK